jgi:hypothetical protein
MTSCNKGRHTMAKHILYFNPYLGGERRCSGRLPDGLNDDRWGGGDGSKGLHPAWNQGSRSEQIGDLMSNTAKRATLDVHKCKTQQKEQL